MTVSSSPTTPGPVHFHFNGPDEQTFLAVMAEITPMFQDLLRYYPETSTMLFGFFGRFVVDDATMLPCLYDSAETLPPADTPETMVTFTIRDYRLWLLGWPRLPELGQRRVPNMLNRAGLCCAMVLYREQAGHWLIQRIAKAKPGG